MDPLSSAPRDARFRDLARSWEGAAAQYGCACMRAALTLVLLGLVAGAPPARASDAGDLEVHVDAAHGTPLRPLPVIARVDVFSSGARVVGACEDEACQL